MPKEYFFLYLIYGSAFINMGIFALQKKEVEVSNFPLVKSLKYLGFFGLSHGVSEWITMLVIADLYPGLYVQFFILKQLLKAISFGCLMYFGISLLPVAPRYRAFVNKIPHSVFAFWLSFFFLLIFRFGWDYHLIDPQYNIIWLRYFMGLPAGMLSATALFLSADWMSKRKLPTIAVKYKRMAYIFFVYGILDGLIVREMDFFPASLINDTLFLSTLGFPIQIGKAMVGIGINILLISVIHTFGWEQKAKLEQLQKNRIASEERRKLGMEIHDGIIQNLYAAGLKAEFLGNNKAVYKRDELLDEIKNDLNNTIVKTREFLGTSSLETIEVEDLVATIGQLVGRFNRTDGLEITMTCRVPTLTLGRLSPKQSTQLYYIVQEAISNVIKHAHATRAQVMLEAQYDYLNVVVSDNGIGINDVKVNEEKHLGIDSMRHRAGSIGGSLEIKRLKKGTKVELQVPWEVSDEEENKSSAG